MSVFGRMMYNLCLVHDGLIVAVDDGEQDVWSTLALDSAGLHVMAIHCDEHTEHPQQ